MTTLDASTDSLSELIRMTLRSSKLVPSDITYVNAHGTGTKQNDLLESRGIRQRVWPGCEFRVRQFGRKRCLVTW